MSNAQYELEFTPACAKHMRKLDPSVRKKIYVGLEKLVDDPHAANQNVTSIKGEDDLLRLRIGNYRVMYKIIQDELVVLAIKVDHRSKIYKH